MDSLDKKLLGILQDAFPITEQPYLVIAQELGISEEETLARVKSLKAAGVIRAINTVFEPKHLGLASALCAAKVDADKLDAVAEKVNQFSEVTHNYARDDAYNLWFTVMSGSDGKLQDICDQVAKLPGVNSLNILPALKKYKLNLNFELSDGQSETDAD